MAIARYGGKEVLLVLLLLVSERVCFSLFEEEFDHFLQPVEELMLRSGGVRHSFVEILCLPKEKNHNQQERIGG